ncbi:FAD-dependent oxidoreductase [Nocardia huaxiensis]|uniref:FAD-dependent oxidoreductase n=1 Tax=Nocardia huaxiensis TaxID=2755382 RepID=A0A7D6VCC5_9NOCA|nr:FAD-dependent oxidoreductase [Nocardia huaxiensis]QLY29417.1 FAD-dependent oxidoreductase [Nocardia huaxiensis]
MSTLNRIVIIGASLAGLRALQALRAAEFAGEIVVVGAEAHLPYNRPPLSKSVLDGDDDVSLPGADILGTDWLRGRQATALRPESKTVVLDDGSELSYDGLVIATGARPRTLDRHPEGVHTLRTLDDALRLRAELAAGHDHLTVVGGGFIGSEVASTARQRGLAVTLVDGGAQPMLATLGHHAARWLTDLHTRHGVELVTGSRATRFEGDDRVTAVRLDSGRSVPAKLVVAGLGVVPNTDWLEGSGVKLDGGVLVTDTLFAEGTDSIVAAGDVARWPHSRHDRALVRVEHWATANDQGALAARNLLAGPADAQPYTAVPTFATRIHGARIQTAGLPHLADEEHVVFGSPADDQFAVAFLANGTPVGAVAVNAHKELNRIKRVIAERGSLEIPAA